MSGIQVEAKNTDVSIGVGAGEPALPRRDWIIIPVLGLLTILLMVILTNLIASKMFYVSKSTVHSCLVLNDPSTGVRAIPNTVCSEKGFESQLVEYRFNSCGHRAGIECGPKPRGTYRIVMVGSSFNYGMYVPRDRSFAALLPEDLEKRTGQKIELYNEAMQWGFPASTVLRFNQALAAQPDMILWVLTPTDIASSSLVLPYIGSSTSAPQGKPFANKIERIKAVFATNPLKTALETIWNDEVVSSWDRKVDSFRAGPTGFLLQHVLYESQSLYVKSYLTGSDSEDGFLRADPSPGWRDNLRQFEVDAAQIEEQAKIAGVPFVAVLVPNRAQAAMLSMGEWPARFDPNKLDNEVRSIVTSHGGIYVSILPEFRSAANPERSYFPVDGHPDVTGHAMIAEMLAKDLTSGAVPAINLEKQAALGASR